MMLEKLRQGLAAGKSLAQLAGELATTKSALWRLAVQHGLQLRAARLTTLQLERIRSLLLESPRRSLRAIALICGCSAKSVWLLATTDAAAADPLPPGPALVKRYRCAGCSHSVIHSPCVICAARAARKFGVPHDS